MWGSFSASVGLHVAVAVIMVVASGMGEMKSKALPSATVVKLIRPMASPNPPGGPSKQGQAAESKSKLEIPSTKKDKKDKTPAEPSKPVSKLPDTPKSGTPGAGGKELKGDAGTLRVGGSGGFEYDFYLAVVQSKIEQNFRPPPGMRGQNLATMGFSIQKSGAVSNIALVKPSGNFLIDQAAERAVRAAGKFPPLPPQYSQGQLDIYFEFVINPAAGR
ncbi:TonB C-terminal domain-containing protein [candidate division KSB1 bacterium]|nr:MAG: TonB C-terminal domain-containing protein [candidate division KSB1 bacterium]